MSLKDFMIRMYKEGHLDAEDIQKCADFRAEVKAAIRDSITEMQSCDDVDKIAASAAGGKIPWTALAVGIPAAIGGIAQLAEMGAWAYDKYLDKGSEKDLQEAIKRYPSLKTVPKQRLQDYYQAINQFAPEIAKNPLLAGYQLERMAEVKGVDIPTLKDLGDASRTLSRDKASVKPISERMSDIQSLAKTYHDTTKK
jgi:hypothetical protein